MPTQSEEAAKQGRGRKARAVTIDAMREAGDIRADEHFTMLAALQRELAAAAAAAAAAADSTWFVQILGGVLGGVWGFLTGKDIMLPGGYAVAHTCCS